MIIKLLVEKDSYVTSLNTSLTDGAKSNFGSASTLDLYKLFNENRRSFSKAFIDFNVDDVNGPFILDQSEIVLHDAQENSITILFDTTLENDNSFLNEQNATYVIGISNVSPSQYSEKISDAINHLSGQNVIKLQSFFNQTQLVIKQTTRGKTGDKEFNILDIENVATSKTAKVNNKNYFSRIDWSFLLIKINLNDLENIWAPNDLNENSAFNVGDFKAELLLKDVSTGISKPRDYSISCYSIKKDFDEGTGKDVHEFSDVGTCNFKDLSQNESWQIEEFVSLGIDTDLDEIDRFDIVKGDEDVIFDITDYIQDVLSGEKVNKGLLIGISESNLFDRKSYFAKRFGSRHLIKKSLVPSLNINIDTAKFQISNNDIVKTKYKISDGVFNFYLPNKRNNLNTDFIYPTGYDSIKVEVKDSEGTDILSKALSDSYSDFKGNEVLGLKVKKVIISDQENGSNFLNPEYFEQSANNSGKVKAKLNWYYSDSNEANEDILIESKDIDVHYTDSDSNTIEENLYVSIKFDKDLTANNRDYPVDVYFIDLNEKVLASKTKYDLVSKYIGDVYYSITDKNTGKVLVDYNDNDMNNATRLVFDGESYKANIFISELFKNCVLEINFMYKNLAGTSSYVKNNNINFKVL